MVEWWHPKWEREGVGNDDERRFYRAAATARGPNVREPGMNGHPVVMFEFIAEDQERLCAFYHDVFGWEYDTESGFAYVNFAPATISTLGGIGQAKPATPGWEPGRSFYLATDDVEASLDAVVTAGGSIYVPITDTDGFRFAMFTDPEGNIVGLLQSTAGKG